MNRLAFFKEMKTGLFKTVASIYEPIMEDDIAKIQKVSDQLLGVQWFFLIKELEDVQNIDQKFINGRPFIIVRQNQTLKAFSGICSVCTQLLNVSTHNFTCKCYNCENEIKLDEDNSNNIYLEEYPLKKEQDGYFIGLKKTVQDDHNA